MHPHPDPAPLLITTLTIVTLCYAAVCARWPFAACRRCRGIGKHLSPGGRSWRYCRRCKGTGGRLRAGRRAWNYLRSRRDAAAPPRPGRRDTTTRPFQAPKE